MDAAEIALVRSAVEGALRDTPGHEVPAVLAKLGWVELRAVEPVVAVAELFEAQGRLVAATPMLDLVVAGALDAPLPDGAAVVHPALGVWDGPPASSAGNGTAVVDGLALAGLSRAGVLAVPCREADGNLSLVAVDPEDLECTAVTGFDEELGLVAVRGRIPAGGGQPLAGSWPAATAAARRALGHELVGLAQHMLDDAARHVTDRFQFQRPIAMFQAVRHRLAEVHVAVASTRPVLAAAWTVADPLAADAAKVMAGRAGQLASKHCLQVTGAIGFTWEHGLHRSIRRVHLLDALYGSADALQGRIGATLLHSRAVPRLGVMGP